MAGPRRGGWWAELLGLGDWQYELGVQIVDICVSTRDINGGLIEMNELIRILLKLRGVEGMPKGKGEGVVREVERAHAREEAREQREERLRGALVGAAVGHDDDGHGVPERAVLERELLEVRERGADVGGVGGMVDGMDMMMVGGERAVVDALGGMDGCD